MLFLTFLFSAKVSGNTCKESQPQCSGKRESVNICFVESSMQEMFLSTPAIPRVCGYKSEKYFTDRPQRYKTCFK